MMSVLVNVFIAVSSVAAWVCMVRGSGGDEALAMSGLGSLKYYTVLSNLFSAIVSVVYATNLSLAGGAVAPWLLALKLVAASVVMLTFLVTALLLAPGFGWRVMYSGGNFWLHLVCPLLAAADVVFLVPLGSLPLWCTTLAMVPTALYAFGYVQSIRLHGAEENGKVYDFYNFLRWGEDAILVVGVAMLLFTWAIALGLYGANALVH